MILVRLPAWGSRLLIGGSRIADKDTRLIFDPNCDSIMFPKSWTKPCDDLVGLTLENPAAQIDIVPESLATEHKEGATSILSFLLESNSWSLTEILLDLGKKRIGFGEPTDEYAFIPSSLPLIPSFRSRSRDRCFVQQSVERRTHNEQELAIGSSLNLLQVFREDSGTSDFESQRSKSSLRKNLTTVSFRSTSNFFEIATCHKAKLTDIVPGSQISPGRMGSCVCDKAICKGTARFLPI